MFKSQDNDCTDTSVLNFLSPPIEIKPEPHPISLHLNRPEEAVRRKSIEIKPEPLPISPPLSWESPKEDSQTRVEIETIIPPTPKRISTNDTRNGRLKDLAAEVLTTFRERPITDRFSIFGNYIAEHLRILPPNEATTLESRLSQTLFSFLGARTADDGKNTSDELNPCKKHKHNGDV